MIFAALEDVWRISASLFCRCSVASRRILMRLGPRDLSCKFCLAGGIEFAWAKFHYNLLQLVSLTSESCAFKKHLFWICLGKRSHDPTLLQGWFWMVVKYAKKLTHHLAMLPGKVALVHLQRRRIVQRSGRDEIRQRGGHHSNGSESHLTSIATNHPFSRRNPPCVLEVSNMDLVL